MRDKVKRFISILMTALMLVNLMPVGALADGITSIGYKPEVAASTGYYKVYVYARFDGDPLPGVTLNASQWYTIGYIANVNLPSPGGISWGKYWYYNNNNYCGSTINSTSASGIIGGLVQEYNKSIVIKSDEWISANFKACPGADIYMEGTSEPAWHLDIIVDINKNPPVHNLVFKVNNSNGKQIGTPKKVTGRWTNPLSANKYYAGNPVPETIIDGGRIYQLKTKREGNPNLDTKIYFDEPIKNVEFYYKDMGPVKRNYTVNHYWMGEQNKPIQTETKEADLGSTVTKSPIKIDGYTPVSDASQSITITEGTNVINFYYYKNVELEANSKTVPYNGQEQSVSGFTGAPEDADFSAITVGAKGTDVGTYTAAFAEGTVDTVDATGKYIVTKAINGTLKITPVETEVVVKIAGNTKTETYNGNPYSVEGYTVTSISNPLYTANDFTFSGTAEAKGTDAGTYPMGLTADQFTNNKSKNFSKVTFVIEDGQLVIEKRKVTLTSASDSKVYDGTPLTKKEVTVGGDGFAKDEGVTYTFTGSQTNAGSSKNMFTYAWNEGTKADNYTICPIEGDLVITPIDGIKVTITGRKDTQTYDGKPHKVEGYDVKPDNPLFTEKDIEFNGEAEATGTDVRIDPYQMGLKPEQFTNTSNNFTNVEFVVEDGQIVITPRPVTLTSETASKTYDGTALEKPVVTVGGDGFVEGQVKQIKATGSVTNAGSVANTITFTPNKETFKEGNYAITKTEGTLTIAKRSVLITSQSATKTYDGSALTRPAVTIPGDGFVPGELAKAEATGSLTKVGSTPNAIQYTTTGAFNAANYSIALSVGTLTVTEKPKPEPRRTFNLTINYVYQNGKRAAASYNRGGLKNGETFDITSPVIAGYTASETVVSGTIYNRDIKVTVIYTADGVNLDDYGVPLGLGNITMNVGDCFE